MSAFLAAGVFAQDWRKMSDADLKAAVPVKAPVIKEDIETELRTASGITDGKASVFGVVIITAGYEADGKYTHFLRTKTRLRVSDLDLAPGDYVFGYRRVDAQSLNVTFYQAMGGTVVGSIKAGVEQKKGAIYSFLIVPPVGNAGKIYIGRFSFDYILK
ncbi:MAG: hypothetical protein HOP17_17150 [Acidobacteria bacterium]|nr:hypothetical protein [Acidobacteriota bacterium]